MKKEKKTFIAAMAFSILPGVAFAGFPTPAPGIVAGAAGPVGIGLCIAGYVGYRLLKKKK